MKLRRHVPIYKQKQGTNDCGPTCVRMAINSFLPKEKMLSREDFPKGRKTKDAIKRMIKAKGFRFTESTWQTKKDSLRFLRESIRKNRPVILSCRSYFKHYGRDSHYIVLKGIDKKYIYVNDPYPRKPAKIDIDNFAVNGPQPGQKETRWGRSRWAVALFQ